MIKNLKLSHLLLVLLLIGITVGLLNLNINFKPSSLNITNHKPEYLQDKLKNNELAPKLVIIPKGVGTVGNDDFSPFKNEAPAHKVIVTKEYALGVTEVTFAQYDQFCQTSKIKCPSDEGWGRDNQPVINVDWHDAVAYTEWLSKQTGYTYRLPSEAEWEFAARAGQNTKFWWGNNYIQGLDHCDRDMGGCPKGSDLGQAWQVAILTANPFGLYDMTSNVGEWVLDCASVNHINANETMQPNLLNGCPDKISKGGDWQTAQPYVQHSSRAVLAKNDTFSALGFRVLREIN